MKSCVSGFKWKSGASLGCCLLSVAKSQQTAEWDCGRSDFSQGSSLPFWSVVLRLWWSQILNYFCYFYWSIFIPVHISMHQAIWPILCSTYWISSETTVLCSRVPWLWHRKWFYFLTFLMPRLWLVKRLIISLCTNRAESVVELETEKSCLFICWLNKDNDSILYNILNQKWRDW